MARNIAGAIEEVREHLEYVKPRTEDEALEAGQEALNQHIDGALIYTFDVLELWDGSTHPEVDMSSVDDIMSAVAMSTFYQLSEDWNDALYDGMDAYIKRHLSEDDWEDGEIDRDEALAIINGG